MDESFNSSNNSSQKRKRKTPEQRKVARRTLVEQIKRDRATFVVWTILRIVVIFIAIRCAIQSLWESLLCCILTLILFLAPPFVERSFRIKLPTVLEVTVFIFIFCAEILGEIECYYLKYPFWDAMLHTVNGFLFAAFGFCLVDLLNENKRFRFALSPTFQSVVAFCFSMTIGILWEFFEFGADHLLGLDMQKDTMLTHFQSVALDPTQSNTPIVVKDIVQTVIQTANGESFIINGYLDVGLTDTMKDLAVNFVGALLFCMIGWLYIRHRGKNRIAAAFIPVVEPPESE